MELIDLSHTIASGMPQWRSDNQPLLLHRRSRHGPDSHMSSSLEIGCHVGTHIDAALHFLAGQPGVDALPLDRFYGPALVLDVRDKKSGVAAPEALAPEILNGIDLAGVDFLLLLTGWDQFWGEERYYREWPFLSRELAQILADAGLKGVGLDTPSLDDFQGHWAHDICAAKGMINIENLTGLNLIAGMKVDFQAFPLKLESTEASPVRAVAWVKK